MKIEVEIKDRDGNPIEIGDSVELFDWDGEDRLGVRPLGVVVEVVWDNVEGRVSSIPDPVQDAYEFWSKALPRCRKVGQSRGRC
jgi:hypothetical protein